MNDNHKLENILADIGNEPVPADVHELAENIVNQFRTELAQQSDDAAITEAPTPPAVRLVPDVPTELADGVQRETLPISQPPDRRYMRRRFVAMFQSKTVRWSAVAAVAAVVILVIGFWPGNNNHNPGSAFAAAVEQFQKARTIVCNITTTARMQTPGIPFQQTGKLYFSTEYGSRCDMMANGVPMITQYAPLQGPSTTITPSTRTYTVMDSQALGNEASKGNGPDGFIRMFTRLKAQASRELGSKNIDGIEALGYEIDGQMLGIGAGEGFRSELWIDAKSYLPVRCVTEMPIAQISGTCEMVYDQFQWDTPLEASLFTPEIPADYTRIDTKASTPDEAMMIKALGNYAELAEKYPPAVNAASIVSDLSPTLGARVTKAMIRGEKALDQKAIMQKSAEIGAGFRYYQMLTDQGRSPEYFGKTVKPGEANAVLLRWNLDGGQQRVIYGDLRVETVSGK